MKKNIIFALTAGILLAIILTVISVSEYVDLEESEGNEEEIIEEEKPQGRDLSVQLEEKMGFSAP